MERIRDVALLATGAPGRQRLVKQRIGLREVAAQLLDAGDVDEVRCRDFVASLPAIDGERRVEVRARLVEGTRALRQRSREVVVVGGEPARVADPFAQWNRLRVAVAGGREVTARFVETREAR